MAQKADPIVTALNVLIEEHGRATVTAAGKAVGVRLAEIQEVPPNQLEISDRIPADKAPHVRDKKAEVWNGLRQHRLALIQAKLQELREEDVHRFNQCVEGVNPVDPDAIPVDGLGGMDEFKHGVEKMMLKSKHEQERKANMIVTDFLESQRAAKEAKERAADLERRRQEFKQALEDKYEARRKELQKKEQKRKDGAARAAEARREYENKCEEEMEMKMERAKKTRAEIYNKDKLREQAAESDKKRRYAFDQALAKELRVQGHIVDKMTRVDQRLHERSEVIAEEIREKKAASDEAFAKQRAQLHNFMEDKRMTRERKHHEYMTQCDTNRESGRQLLATRSKSCGDIRRKAVTKQRSNIDRIHNEMLTGHSEILERHRLASERCADLGALQLKCGQDIFSFQEVKHKTFGLLTTKNREMNKRCQDAEMQALVIELAERDAAAAAQARGRQKQADYRQKVFGETLKLQDHSREAFQKIQSSNNPEKIAKVMEGLGLPMPKLPEKEGAAGGDEEDKPAY